MTYTATHVHPGYGSQADHFVAKDDDCEEIGDGVCIRPAFHWRPDRGETEADGQIVGYVVAHDVEDQEARCEGAVMIEDGFGPPVWTQTGSLAGGDLTLAPSVQCKTHPEFHAHVQGGRWTGTA